METVLVKAVQLILSLSLLVIVHEFGHFMFARIFKVRVEKFYLFFNPWFSLFKFKPKNSDTEYGVGWLPLGGYVKIAGMIDESMDKDQMAQPEQPWEFRSKPAWQRLLIMIGGVMFNLILAFFIYSMVLFTWGEKYIPMKNVKSGMYFSEVAKEIGFCNGDIILGVDGEDFERFDDKTLRAILNGKEVFVDRQGVETLVEMPGNAMERVLADGKVSFAAMAYPMVVADIQAGEGAQKAGMMSNDSIVSINGVSIGSVYDARDVLLPIKGQVAQVAFSRNGVVDTLAVSINESGNLGVMIKDITQFYTVKTMEYSFWESFPKGATMAYNKLTGYVSDLKMLFTKEGAKSLGGFVAIGSIFPDGWHWEGFWQITAFLSVILAFMNIIPIPALDGGHVLFLIYEVVTRRKPNEKFVEYAQYVGMILLIGLMLFANGQDLFRLFGR